MKLDYNSALDIFTYVKGIDSRRESWLSFIRRPGKISDVCSVVVVG